MTRIALCAYPAFIAGGAVVCGLPQERHTHRADRPSTLFAYNDLGSPFILRFAMSFPSGILGYCIFIPPGSMAMPLEEAACRKSVAADEWLTVRRHRLRDQQSLLAVRALVADLAFFRCRFRFVGMGIGEVRLAGDIARTHAWLAVSIWLGMLALRIACATPKRPLGAGSLTHGLAT